MITALAALTLAACMAPAQAVTTRNHPSKVPDDKQYSIAADPPYVAVAAMTSPARPPSGAWTIAALPRTDRIAAPASSVAKTHAAEPLRAWLARANHLLAGE